MGKCSVESCTKETYRNAKHCPRHAVQLRKYGMIVSDKPSYKDLNEIRIYENYAEIVLRSKMGDDIAVSRIDLDVVALINDKKWYLTEHGYCASRGKKGSCLGVFLTIQEAKNAYDEKSKELFGEFARIAA